MLRSPVRAVVPVCLLSAPLLAQGAVHVVDDDDPTAPFADIQSALAAASDGDTVLVKEGSYPSFDLSALGVTIAAESGALVRVTGGWLVRNLAPAQTAVLRGLTIDPPNGQGVIIDNCAGPVLVEDCLLVGESPASAAADGLAAARVLFCDSVSFLRTSFEGGNGGDLPGFPFLTLANGGDGLATGGSNVFVQSCTLRGGDGGNQASGVFPCLGGAGIRLGLGDLHVLDSEVRGGDGGASPSLLGGDGGPGVRLQADTAVATVADSQVSGGQPGTTGSGAPADPGQAFEVITGTVQLLGLVNRFATVQVSSPVREGQLAVLDYDSSTGAQALLLLIDTGLTPTPLPGLPGLLYSPAATALPLGNTTPVGDFQMGFPVPNLLPPMTGTTLFVQVAGVALLNGEVVAGGVSALTLLDSAL